eukprot:CAMPEP_0202434414 /NCGR_PEP_ID=MMETSP1345-20130828/15251_1 /ASSEMBLY_ACC=CAM_ASM_000843 /TAXON_ID=342563 /ORGANISM="Fabrea Fabrea salina" /LENGTH=118 /DNA_ID=CAMNT_0049047085 /DNA_START=48 /DNA_END=404 /DNA_ORIENTATION=-
MAGQLSAHLRTIDELKHHIKTLEGEKADLNKKLQKKNEMLRQELKDKEMLVDRVQELERNLPSSSQSWLSRFKGFLAKKTPPPQEQVPEEEPSAIVSNEVDITAELEKLGVTDLVKKY